MYTTHEKTRFYEEMRHRYRMRGDTQEMRIKISKIQEKHEEKKEEEIT